MDLDPVLLSRLQFAWVIGWHILLPAFTVGMALRRGPSAQTLLIATLAPLPPGGP